MYGKRMTIGLTLGALLAAMISVRATSVRAEEQKKITYDDHVQAIFRQKCFSCHNTDKKSGGLDLTSYTNMMQGGGSGAPVEPGSPDSSYLYLLVSHQSEPYMPPNSEKLPEEMLKTISAWIEGGALENSGSKPVASKKPKVNLTLKDAPTARPEVIPMPGHLEKQPVTTPPVPGAITAMATSPWAPLAAIGGQKQVLLYNTQSLQLLGVLPFPEGVPHVLKFSRSGNLLLAGGGHAGASGRVVVWDITSGQRVFEVGDELDAVLAADISADQSLIALGGPQKVVRVYATADGSLQFEMRKHTDWIYSIEFSPDGVLLATGDRAGNLMVWEGYTGREYLTLKGHTAAITGLSWRADSNIVASSSEDTTIRLWEMENGNAVKSWNGHGGGTTSVEFVRDGRLVSVGRDRVAKLWDQNGQAIRQFDAMSDIAVSVTYCDETNRVVASDWLGTVTVWDAAEGKAAGNLVANPPPLATRLALAEEALAARTAEAAPLIAALQAAQQQAEQATAGQVAAQTAFDKATADQAAAKTAFEQATAATQQAEAALKTTTDQVTRLTAVVPKLRQAAELAKESAAALTGDMPAAELLAKATALADRVAADLAAAQKLAAEQQAAVEASRKTMTDAQAALAKLDADLPVSKKQLDDSIAAAKAAEEAAAAAATAAQPAQQALAAAQTELEFWKKELDFHAQMEQMRAAQQAAEQQAAAAEAELGTLRDTATTAAQAAADAVTALANAQTAATTAQQAEAAAKQAAAEAQAAKTTTAAAFDAAKQQQATLETATAALAEAVTKSQEAAAKTGDAELKAAADSLVALATKKQGELEAAKKMVTDTEAAATQAASQVTAAELELKAKSEAYQAAAAQVAALQKQSDELAAQDAAAKAAVAAAEAKANEARQQADQVAQQILAAHTGS